jgi:hypothetical protein
MHQASQAVLLWRQSVQRSRDSAAQPHSGGSLHTDLLFLGLTCSPVAAGMPRSIPCCWHVWQQTYCRWLVGCVPRRPSCCAT